MKGSYQELENDDVLCQQQKALEPRRIIEEHELE